MKFDRYRRCLFKFKNNTVQRTCFTKYYTHNGTNRKCSMFSTQTQVKYFLRVFGKYTRILAKISIPNKYSNTLKKLYLNTVFGIGTYNKSIQNIFNTL